MTISDVGLALIKRFEGLRLSAYICPAGVLTIGYGSTGPHVKPGMVITEAQADALLRQDVARFDAEVARVPGLSQHQHDACVSFAFNVGERAFRSSTLRRLLLRKEWTLAAAQFDRWTRGGGKVLPGLVKRRAAERQLFEGKA